MFKVAAIDVDANKEIAQMFGIQGFPTIKVFPPERQMNPYTKKMFKTPLDYQGPRTGKLVFARMSEERVLTANTTSPTPNTET